MLRTKTRTIAAIVLVAALIALNVYTVEVLSLKSPSPIPAYPAVALAFSDGNLMILIKAALGTYFYNSITINGTYSLAGGTNATISNTTLNSIYLGMTLHTTNATFNSTAVDLLNHEIYYFNATVKVNLSMSSNDIVLNYPGGETNQIVLGVNPIEEPMEGVSYG